jgi:hypothetical protein
MWALNLVIILGALRFLIQDRFRFLRAHAAMGVVMAAMYALSGGVTGSVMSSASALTSAGQAFLGDSARRLFRAGVALPAVALAIVLKEPGMWAWLPVAAFLVARSAEALLDNLGMRKAFLVTSTAWLVYAASLSLWVVASVEVLIVALGVVTVVRLERSRRAGPEAT